MIKSSKEALLAQGRELHREKAALRSQAALRAMRVLVVEDDPELQWRVARMLTVQGSRVVGTSTGEGALALIAQWPVDWVLVDDELPGMSGMQFIEHLRLHYPSASIAMMMSRSDASLRDAAKAMGVRVFLEKPIRKEMLQSLLGAKASQPSSPLAAE